MSKANITLMQLLIIFFTSIVMAETTLNPSGQASAHEADDVGTIEEFDPSIQLASDYFQNQNADLQGDFSDSLDSGQMCETPDCRSGLSAPSQAQIDAASGTISGLPAAQGADWAERLQSQFNNYSYHARIVRLIDQARQNLRVKSYIERRYDSVRKRYYNVAYCYRAVKDALLGARFVNHYLDGGEARVAIPVLERVGFKNLMSNPNYANVFARHPEMAPRGTILIFRNNPNYRPCANGCARPHIAGHIEIKTQDSGRHGYISVSESTRPTYGYLVPQQRELIGVMYKENL